jgi:autotransporter-associated beta strand protein
MNNHRVFNVRLACTWRLCPVVPVIGIVLVIAKAALGDSATWKMRPTSGDWNTAANWTPETVPNGPTDIATFDVSNTTDVSVSEIVFLDSMVFNPGASVYHIGLHGALEGTGLINNSGVIQNIDSVDGSDFGFIGNATAGNGVIYTNNGEVPPLGFATVFNDTSNAGSATFINKGDSAGVEAAVMFFLDSTSASNSTIINQSGDTYGAITQFEDSATAASSTITVYPGALLSFRNSATGATSTLIADGGTISFGGFTTGELSRIELLDGGVLNIMAHKNTVMAIGSLEGESSSQVELGKRQLTIGGNGLSTRFDGLIKDDALQMGSVVKTGSETLTLTHANSYGAGTTITGGTLIAQAAIGSATGTGPVQVNAGTFGGTGSVTGAVTIGTGTGPRAFLAPGVTGPGTLSILNTLTFKNDGSYKYELGLTPHPRADQVIANGVTIETGATFVLRTRGNQTLPRGTIFTVISDTAGTAISGTFANLPDGSTFTIGNNTLQVNYEGGDGKDLTLTVVQ